MDESINKIVDWAHDRNLVFGSNPQAQMMKLLEEVGELSAGIARGDTDMSSDAIGDCIVVLTIISEQLGLYLPACVDGAYEEIKDRKGRMVKGIFVKDE